MGSFMLIYIVVKIQRMPLRYIPSNQKITLPDGRVLKGPNYYLGKGGFANVYSYTLANESVAVKIPKTEHGNELQQNEIELLNQVSWHPNIMHVITGLQIEKRIWIIMPQMKGSVRDLLDKNPALSSTTKLSVALQMTRGLAHLHNLKSGLFSQKGILHQDLKPENLFVDSLADSSHITVKIGDFGLARAIYQTNLPFKCNKPTGYLGGTSSYLAPEVRRAIQHKKNCCYLKSDIFSAGIIFWELATTQQPNRSKLEIEQGTFNAFIEEQKSQTIVSHQTSFYAGPKKITSKPTYPHSLFFGPIIDKCIQYELKDRPSAKKTLALLAAQVSHAL